MTGVFISTLATKIRDFVNSPRKQASLLSDTASWNTLCSATDVIGDTDLALAAYLQRESQTDDGENYLLVYGTLQVMEVQQDAVKFLCDSLRVPYTHPKELRDIRKVRSDSIGHSMKENENKVTKSNFISRSNLTQRGFTLLTVYSDDTPYPHQYVDIMRLLEVPRDLIKAKLTEIVHKLRIEEMAHRKEHKAELLQDLFPDTLGYLISKILEGSPVAKVHVREIRRMISQFQEALKKRGEWIDGSPIVYEVELAEYPLDEIESFLETASDSRLNERDIYIFGTFVKAQVEQLRKIAKEIDEKYGSSA